MKVDGKPYRTIWLGADGRTVQVIDQTLWPDAKVEPQQVGFHRTALVRALAEAVGQDRANGLVTTVKGHGLMLELPAERVCVV